MVQLIPHIFFQVVLESIPISSSGHVFLLFFFLKSFTSFQSSDVNNESVEFLLHLPTLLIIGLYFFAPWWQLLKDIVHAKKEALLILGWCILVDSITVFWYCVLSHVGTWWFPLSLGFFITGVCLYSLKHCISDKKQQVTLRNGVIMGMAQGCALLPGISRFGITFFAARWLGFSHKQSFEYSFLIQFPLICAALLKGFYKIDYLFLQTHFLTVSTLGVFLISGVISYFVLCWVGKVIERGNMWRFCFYLVPLSLYVCLFLKK